MQAWIAGFVGVLLGGFLAWWFATLRGRSQVEGAQAEARGKEALLLELRAQVERADALLKEERRLHGEDSARLHSLEAHLAAERAATAQRIASEGDAEKRANQHFGALAAQALDANSRRLLELHRAELDRQRLAATQELGNRESAISKMLQPMGEQLKTLADHSQMLEVKREGAYQAMLREMDTMRSSHTDLRRETAQLVQALRAPKARGNWGEMQLRRCVEHAGMVEHASFEVERTVHGDDAALRPDLVVRLPNQRCVIVDAKTPLDSFLSANGCDDESLRDRHLAAHAAAVRGHLQSLASKAYWSRFTNSPDFVICFLPSEVLFSAALEQDPSLLDFSAGGRVLLATPTTLIAMLKSVAYGWQQAGIARDAERIRDAAAKVHAKLAGMHTAFANLGNALRKAGDCYDDALIKAEGRGGLFSLARQLREMKVGEKDLPENKPVAFRPRALDHEDWDTGLSFAAGAPADGSAAPEQPAADAPIMSLNAADVA